MLCKELPTEEAEPKTPNLTATKPLLYNPRIGIEYMWQTSDAGLLS